MKKEAVTRLFEELSRQRLDPKTELEYTNHYTLLIAVVLSAQATDKSVNKACADLFKTIKTPKAMLAFGEEKLRNEIKSIGLYKTKAKNVIALSKILVERHQGKIPENREDLEALPGVGRKTANVILNEAFNLPTIAVDTHIFRVSNRTGLAPGKTVIEVEKKLLKTIPKEYQLGAHHWLILHGRYVCKARKPLCPSCVIYDACTYQHKTEA